MPLNIPLALLLLWFLLPGCSYENVNLQELHQIAAEINKKCPKMLDSETRLDAIEVKEPNTLVYKYSLVNLDGLNVDTLAFYRALWPGIISHIKVSPDMRRLKESNTSIEYYYQDKNGRPVYTFHISPSDYK